MVHDKAGMSHPLNGEYMYVRHEDAEKYERLGWVPAADLGPPHDEFASLWRWPFPERTCETPE